MTMPLTELSKPALSRRARLQYDEVRQLDLLLLPERAVKLNRSAAAILALCDGQRTVGEIARELETRFEQPGLLNEILEFLHQASDQRWVV